MITLKVPSLKGKYSNDPLTKLNPELKGAKLDFAAFSCRIDPSNPTTIFGVIVEKINLAVDPGPIPLSRTIEFLVISNF